MAWLCYLLVKALSFVTCLNRFPTEEPCDEMPTKFYIPSETWFLKGRRKTEGSDVIAPSCIFFPIKDYCR